MIQLRERLGLAREATGERGVAANAGRKNFERDDAVQLLLPRLVNRAHAALADEFKHFQLREQRREFGHRWRRERRRLPARGRLVGRALFQQAGGAKSGQRAGRQRGAALRAFISIGHGLVQFYCVHAFFRSKSRKMLPERIGNHETHKMTRKNSRSDFRVVRVFRGQNQRSLNPP